ncbi:MAG: RNA polymerase sigma factor [Spirochaetota bacterium]
MNTFNIPDRKIKKLIQVYKNGDNNAYLKVVDLLSAYVYHYPRMVYSVDHDICGGYYEYILARLKKILSGYTESEAQFITWFTVVLRRRYLNFIREKKQDHLVKENYRFLSFDLINENSPGLYNLVSDNRNYHYSEGEGVSELVDKIVRELNHNHRVFFHLYYIETLRPEDIGFLAASLNRSVQQIVRGLDSIRNSMVVKYRSRNLLLQKLTTVYQNILNAQREGNREEVSRYRKKQSRLLNEYRSLKLNPTYRSLADFLNVPPGTVSTGISRMKEAVRKCLKGYAHERMQIQ